MPRQPAAGFKRPLTKWPSRASSSPPPAHRASCSPRVVPQQSLSARRDRLPQRTRPAPTHSPAVGSEFAFARAHRSNPATTSAHAHHRPRARRLAAARHKRSRGDCCAVQRIPATRRRGGPPRFAAGLGPADSSNRDAPADVPLQFAQPSSMRRRFWRTRNSPQRIRNRESCPTLASVTLNLEASGVATLRRRSFFLPLRSLPL